MLIIARSLDDLTKKLNLVIDQLAQDAKSIKDSQGIYFAALENNDLAKAGKLAFLFPGQGSQYPGMLNDLAVRFAEVEKQCAKANRVLNDRLNKALSMYIFPPPAFSTEEQAKQKEALTDTRIAQPAMGAADMALLALLESFALKPDMLAGHSYGEYVALCAAGYFDFEQMITISAERGRILAEAAHGDNNGDRFRGAMAAAACSAEALAKHLPEMGAQVHIANYNSPAQTIISGAAEEIDKAVDFLQKKDIAARRIAVSQAFHTPHMKDAAEKLVAVLKKARFSSAEIDTYSNTTGNKYERSSDNLENLLGRHTVEAVNFIKQIDNMYTDGARVFLEVGPGNVLTGLASAILKQRTDAVCISIDKQGRDSLLGLLHALAQLSINGIDIDWQRLYQYRLAYLKPVLDVDATAVSTQPVRSNKQLVYLVNSVGVRTKFGQKTKSSSINESANLNVREKNKVLAEVQTNFAVQNTNNVLNIKPAAEGSWQTGTINNRSAEQVMQQFQQTMQEMSRTFLETQQKVMSAYLTGRTYDTQRADISLSALDATVTAKINQQALDYSASNNHGAENFTPSESNVTPVEQVGEIDIDSLVNGLLEIVAERTGYPADMIDPTLDLEADLGIDSIKRVEILNKFRRMLPESTQRQLEAGIEELAGTRTLQGIIEWLRANHNKPHDQQLAVSVSSESVQGAHGNGGNGKHDNVRLEEIAGQQYLHQSSEGNGKEPASVGGNGKDHSHSTPVKTDEKPANKLRRATVEPVVLPDLPALEANALQKHYQTALITADQFGLAQALAETLNNNGLKSIIIKPDADLDLQDGDKVASYLAQCESKFGKINLFYHLQSYGEQNALANKASTLGLLHLLKYFSRHASADQHKNGTSVKQKLIAVTSMGGTFGINCSAHIFTYTSSCCGLIKVAAKESPTINCHAIDFVNLSQDISQF